MDKPQQRRMMKKPVAVLTAIAAFSINSELLAGGFQISDHSITSLGRSHAGYGVVGDDISAAHYNPSGLTLFNQTQVQSGISFLDVEATFNNTGSTGSNTGPDGNGAQDSTVPHFYMVTPLSTNLTFGMGITAPFGTNTKYDDDFIGRYNGLETQITTINLNPSIGYKLNDTVSLGLGVNYQSFDATLAGALTPLAPGSKLAVEGDSAQWGLNAGLLFNFADTSRLGISYRSRMHHDITGSATFSGLSAGNGSFDATAEFTVPETLYVGYYKPVSDKLKLSLGYRWTRWSRFRNLEILFPAGIAAQRSEITANWHNSETISAGLDYAMNPKWTLRGGISFDQTPVPDETRSVRTVDSDRIWYTLGAGYQMSQRLTLDFAYRYIAFDDAPVDRDARPSTPALGRLVGNFNNISAHTIAAQAKYTF